MNDAKTGLAGIFHSLGPTRILILLVALALCIGFVISHPAEAALYLPFLLPMFGAVTVTYENPQSVNGGTVAPTAAQSLLTNRVGANVIASADADTTATLTHNYGIPAGPGPTGGTLANGSPIMILEVLLQASGALSLWAVTSKTTNTCVLTKATTAGSGNASAQLRIHAIRHSTLDC